MLTNPILDRDYAARINFALQHPGIVGISNPGSPGDNVAPGALPASSGNTERIT